MSNYLTKAEAIKAFREAYRPVRGDRVANFEAWADFTDHLHRDGCISDSQVNSWANPYGV